MIRITIFCERVQERGAEAVDLMGESRTADAERLRELKEMLDSIEKEYGLGYEKLDYFAAVNKEELFMLTVGGKKNGRLYIGA